MFKKILVLFLAVAMLSLTSCRIVEIIDHSTTAPEGTTEPPKEYSPWGFWHSYSSSVAVELSERDNAVKLYSLTTGYYEYYHIIETTYTRDDDVFTVVWEDKTYTFTFDKLKNTLEMSSSSDTTSTPVAYVHMDKAPIEHPEPSFPDYAALNPSSYITLGEIDYTGIPSSVREGAPYDIAMAFYGDMAKFPKLENVSRPAQSGDCVNIHYSGKLDDVPFEGGTARNQMAFLSDYKNGYIPGFTDGIIGRSVGETFDVEVTFPEDYHATDLAGKAVVFTMTLNSICDLSLTDEDVAEFTKDTYKTYAEWLEAEKTALTKSLFTNAVLEATSAEKIPEEAYTYLYQRLLDEAHRRAHEYNISYEMFMLYTGMTEMTLFQQAFYQATYNMALYVLAENNELAWTEEDYSAKYEECVADYLKAYPEASREDACKQVDKITLQIKHELTEEMVLEWAKDNFFVAEQE